MSETKTRFDIGDNLSKSTELLDDAAYIFAIGSAVTRVIYAIIFLMVVYIIFTSMTSERLYPGGGSTSMQQLGANPTIMQRVAGMFE